jgi:RNA polymerase sigma factor (sigma-70 family)
MGQMTRSGIGKQWGEPCLAALLCKAQRGDRAAFDALQAALLKPVTRFVARLIGPDEGEKDVVRESFLALYLNLERMDRPDALLPFLFRVARNRSYDVLRRKGRFDLVSLDAEPGTGGMNAEHLRAAGPTPGEAVERMFVWSEVRRAIDRLPELQRQTLILYAEEDFTYPQIAEAMATDIGTVRSRLYHARRNLMRCLRPDTLGTLGLAKEEPG